MTAYIDQLIREGKSFAVYRLPWSDTIQLTLQEGNPMPAIVDAISELHGIRGFVMAPFEPKDEQNPIVCIRPDVVKQFALSRLHFTDQASTDHSPIKSHPDRAAYTAAFAAFIQALRRGTFRKLVLSRAETVDVPEAFSLGDTFLRACIRYPRMMIYLCHTPLTGTWMGCTPEILLSGKANEWTTVALAGTLPADEGEAHWSTKNREEQQLVTEYIRTVLHPHCTQVYEEGPYTTRAGNLLHLKTSFRFVPQSRAHLGTLLKALHPTPAVCGLPKEEAQCFILLNEGYPRDYYSGFVGWIDPTDATHLYVNLRCMHRPDTPDAPLTLYAGGGILSSSECDKEWEETTEKMGTIKEILG